VLARATICVPACSRHFLHDSALCAELIHLVLRSPAAGITACFTSPPSSSLLPPSLPGLSPVILPDYADLELRIADDARCSAIVCFDGRDSRELDRGDSIKVRMSPNPVPTINNADQVCAGWGGMRSRAVQYGSWC
jgi:hypothetical protein